MKAKLASPIVKIGLPVFVIVAALLYILLAPDTMWKPIYIRIQPDTAAAAAPAEEAGEAVGQPATPEPQEVHDDLVWQPGRGVMYTLNSKVVNLADPGGLRYLQTTIALEFRPLSDEWYALEGEERTLAEEEFVSKLSPRRPLIDDAVTTILSSKSFVDISTIEGKNALKQELLVGINNRLGYQGVVNVYFTEFVVQ